MVTKGIIKSIDLLGNTCTVHIPFFETAGNDPIVETATVSNTPGSYNGYKVGDVVYVAFEDGSMNNPVIIGKLYLGVEKEKSDPRGVVNVEESNSSKKATLPADAKLSIETNSNVPNTMAPYNSLSSIANGLNTLNTNVGQMDRDYGNRFKQVFSSIDNQNNEFKTELEQTANNIKAEALLKNEENKHTGFGWNLSTDGWKIYSTDSNHTALKDIGIFSVDNEGVKIAGDLQIVGYPKVNITSYLSSNDDDDADITSTGKINKIPEENEKGINTLTTHWGYSDGKINTNFSTPDYTKKYVWKLACDITYEPYQYKETDSDGNSKTKTMLLEVVKNITYECLAIAEEEASSSSDGPKSRRRPVTDKGYVLAQGKSTNYYNEKEPYRASTLPTTLQNKDDYFCAPNLKIGDCWFNTSRLLVYSPNNSEENNKVNFKTPYECVGYLYKDEETGEYKKIENAAEIADYLEYLDTKVGQPGTPTYACHSDYEETNPTFNYDENTSTWKYNIPSKGILIKLNTDYLQDSSEINEFLSILTTYILQSSTETGYYEYEDYKYIFNTPKINNILNNLTIQDNNNSLSLCTSGRLFKLSDGSEVDTVNIPGEIINVGDTDFDGNSLSENINIYESNSVYIFVDMVNSGKITFMCDSPKDSYFNSTTDSIYSKAEWAPNKVKVDIYSNSTGELKQCASIDTDGKATWEDIGGEIVTNKVTTNYINALDITAQAINIPGKFKASNLEEDSPVEIGGFTVSNSAIYSSKETIDTSGEGVYLGTDGIRIGDNFWAKTDGTVHATNVTLAPEAEEALKPYIGENGNWYVDGKDTYKQAQGEPGTSITIESITYQAGDNGTTAPTGTWSTNPISVAKGQYLWTKITFSDGSESFTVSYQGNDGSTGTSVLSVVSYYCVSDRDLTETELEGDSPEGWSTTIPSAQKGYDIYEAKKTTYSNSTFSWSKPIKNSMLTVDFINSLGITAQKIDIKEASEDSNNANKKTIFYANADEPNNVKIGNFTVDSNSISLPIIEDGITYKFGKPGTVLMCSGTEGYATIGNSGKLNGWVFGAGANFGVTNEGKVFAQHCKIEHGNFQGSITANDGQITGANILQATLTDTDSISFKNGYSSLSVGDLGEGVEKKNKAITIQIVGGCSFQGDSGNIYSIYAKAYNDKGKAVILLDDYYVNLGKNVEKVYFSDDNGFEQELIFDRPLIIKARQSQASISVNAPDYGKMGSWKLIGFKWQGEKEERKWNSDTNSYERLQLNLTTGNLNIYEYTDQVGLLIGSSIAPASTSDEKTIGKYSLGTSTRPWNTIYSKDGYFLNGQSFTSDQRAKTNIVYNLDNYDSLFDDLKPVSYQYIDNDSKRTHLGFIAQDIEQSLFKNNLTRKDTGLIVITGDGFDPKTDTINDINDTQYLIRYGELHALEVRQIQLLKQRVTELEEKVEKLTKLLEK